MTGTTQQRYTFDGRFAEGKKLIFLMLQDGALLQLNGKTVIDGKDFDSDSVDEQDELYRRAKKFLDEYYGRDVDEDNEDLDDDQKFWRNIEDFDVAPDSTRANGDILRIINH